MKREEINRSVLIVLAVLLFSIIGIAGALPANQDAIPPVIEPLYASASYSRAAEELQAAVGRTPKDAFLYYWLGRCYFEVRHFDLSISSWESAIGLDSARSEYHDWLGRAYGRKAEEDSHSKIASALSMARRTHHQFEVAVQLDATNVDVQRDLIAFMASAPSNLGGGEERALEQIRDSHGEESAAEPPERTFDRDVSCDRRYWHLFTV